MLREDTIGATQLAFADTGSTVTFKLRLEKKFTRWERWKREELKGIACERQGGSVCIPSPEGG